MPSNNTPAVALLPYIEKVHDWICKNGKPFSPAPADMELIEKIIIQCLADHHLTDLSLNDYNRQYVAAINELGEKTAWVNCFRDAGDQDWTPKIISGQGRGYAGFRLKINLTRKKYDAFEAS